MNISFLDLSEDLLRSLYMEWISLEDVSRLDSAICNSQRRIEYLGVIRSNATIFNPGTFLPNLHKQDTFFRWLANRQVKVAQLKLKVQDTQTLMELVNIPKLEKVEHLSLLGDRKKSITKFVNKVIARVSSSLTSIQLKRCDTLVNALQNCVHLTSIVFDSCPKVTDGSLKLFLQHTPFLTSLNIQKAKGVKGSFLNCLAQNCQHLNFLCLDRVTLTEVYIDGDNTMQFPVLSELKLKNFDGRNHCMPPAVLEALVSAAPKLESLSLWGSCVVDDAIFLRLLALLPPLKKLDLFLTKLTDESFFPLATSCRTLTWLDSPYNDEMTDYAAQELVRLLPSLTCLDLRNCPKVLPEHRLYKI